MALFTLPPTLLEDILASTLNISGYPDLPTSRPIFICKENHKQNEGYKNTLFSIFLACRQFYAVAAPLVYKRTVFEFDERGDLDYFLGVIGAANLENIRYLSVDLQMESPTENPCNVRAIRQWTTLLAQLPVTLRGLRLFLPTMGWPKAGTDDGMHPLLRAAVQRFHHLEELSLICELQYVHWDMFSVSSANTRLDAMDLDEAQGSVTAVFPFLRSLHIHGLLRERLGSIQIAEAFSQKVLPSLAILRLQGMDDNPNQAKPGSNYLSEALLALSPLEKFEWLRYEEGRKFRSPVPQCLTDVHLMCLLGRHGQTFRHLKLDLHGHLGRRWDITERAVVSLLVSSPALRHATIIAPFLDIIRFLEGIDRRLPRYEFPSPLKTLTLTLGGLEEQLEEKLKTDQLPVLCSRIEMLGPCRLWLRVVIGEQRPEFTRFGTIAWLYRDNYRRYPDLERSITEYIKTCAKGDSMPETWGEDWCHVSLVDIYDYWPFRDDKPYRE